MLKRQVYTMSPLDLPNKPCSPLSFEVYNCSEISHVVAIFGVVGS
jgi:hypothetical protein